jgi:hypothetical protein
MGKRVRTLLVSAAFVAAFGPLAAVHAQTMPIPDQTTAPVLDQATANAIAAWRAAALNHVDPSLRDTLAAVYADKPVDSSQLNGVMMAKAQAEQAAIGDLDGRSVALISNYYSAVSTAQYASLPITNEVNDF